MTGKIKKGITSYIGKHIKILTDDWKGEFTKGDFYEVITNIHDIPCVVNDSRVMSFDILCYTNDYQIVDNINLDKE